MENKNKQEINKKAKQSKLTGSDKSNPPTCTYLWRSNWLIGSLQSGAPLLVAMFPPP